MQLSDIPKPMRVSDTVRVWFVLMAVFGTAVSLQAQESTFRWVDFHSQKDQSVITWVTRALDAEKWTAIREIGVKYDAALVVTTWRPTPQSPPVADTFNVWSVSLTNRLVTPLLKGVNLRWLDWMPFGNNSAPEPAAIYDNCLGCAADTYFTAFRYDASRHVWAARWIRGGEAAPIWSANAPPGVAWTHVYAVMVDSTGRAMLGTWEHFDYGKQKPAEDVVYQYDVDPVSGLEQMLRLTGKDADRMEQKLCRAEDAVPGLAQGQDSLLCVDTLRPVYERQPITTPPANNRGQSYPGRRSR